MRIIHEFNNGNEPVPHLREYERPVVRLSPLNRVLKAAMDRLAGLVGLVFFAPVFVVVALLILIFDNGPIFYSQMRLGKDGRLFRFFKFRTMVTNADKVLEDLLQANPAAREEWEQTQKLTHDPRISCLGAFLRKTSIDELPQFWNVLKGDMSIVGPRPILKSEMWRYGERIAYYFAVRPGLTGLWQVSGRSDTTYEERLRLDCEYVENQSVLLDLKIMLRTVHVVLFLKGAR